MGLFGGKDSGKDSGRELTRKEMRAFKREPDPRLFGKSQKDWKASKDAKKGK